MRAVGECTPGPQADRTMIFVTSNDGKLREFRKRLEPLGYTVEQRDIGYPEPQALTMEEVVEYGLDHLMEKVEHPVVMVWADRGQEEPSHRVSLAGAELEQKMA